MNKINLENYLIPTTESIKDIAIPGVIVTGAALIGMIKSKNEKNRKIVKEIKKSKGKPTIFKDNYDILEKYENYIIGVCDVGNIDEILRKLDKDIPIFKNIYTIIINLSKYNPLKTSTEKYKLGYEKLQDLYDSIEEIPDPDTSLYKKQCSLESSGYKKVQDKLSLIHQYDFTDKIKYIYEPIVKNMNPQQERDFIKRIPKTTSEYIEKIDYLMERIHNYFNPSGLIDNVKLTRVTKFAVKK